MAIRSPVGDPSYNKDRYWVLNKTLYGLRRSPHHWYNMITGILQKMGLAPLVHDPCLYSGVVKLNSNQPTSSPEIPPKTDPSQHEKIHVGVYVDDFIFYSTDPEEEKRFKEELAKHIKVDFMGGVDYFLGTAFTWLCHDKDNHVYVHLTQTAFTEFSAHRFGVDRMNNIPNMTPYRSGIPIDSIPNPDPSDLDLPQRTKVYQRIVGPITWLATCTRPDISPVLIFLATYSTQPSHQHYKAAIHALKYLYSTSEYGI